MKNIFRNTFVLSFFLFSVAENLIAQNAGIAISSTPFTMDNSAIMHLQATDKGFLAPRMTTTQRNAINTPAQGLLVFDTNTNSFWYYTTLWNELGAGGTDNQDLSLAGNTLMLTNDGTTVDLSGFMDNTDNQTLSISGSTVSIADGNSITLPTGADNLGNHEATLNIRMSGNWLSNDGDSEGLTVSNAGIVGIGTTDPTTGFLSTSPTSVTDFKLDVAGGWLNLDNQAGITFNHDIQGGRPVLWTDNDGTVLRNFDDNASDGIKLQSVDGTTRMFVQENGNVGIGTTLPSTKLHVEGSIKVVDGNQAAGKILTSDANGLASWQVAVSSADNLGNHTATQNVLMNGNWLSNDGDSEGLTVSNAGIVGVGTNAPTTTFLSASPTSVDDFKLDVAGGWLNLDNQAGITFNATGQGGRPVLWTDSDGTILRGFDNNVTDGIKLQSMDGTTRMFVQENGNVGIGTIAPTAKLDVDGKIRGKVPYAHTNLPVSFWNYDAYTLYAFQVSIAVQAGDLLTVECKCNSMALDDDTDGLGQASFWLQADFSNSGNWIIWPNDAIIKVSHNDLVIGNNTRQFLSNPRSTGFYRAYEDGILDFNMGVGVFLTDGTMTLGSCDLSAIIIGKQ